MNTTGENMHFGWADSPNNRGTIDIVWSCVLTIGLCSWSVLTLNVFRGGFWSHLKMKIRWMGYTIFGPEITLGLAQKQWISARHSVAQFKALGYDSWTLEHAFFADMGGFILEPPDYPPFPISAHQVLYLVANGSIEYPHVGREDIEDKNKSDGFSRLLISVQVIWFALQCVGRAVQKLHMSTLELETVAFVLCTLPTYYFWRRKPQDVTGKLSLYLKEGITIRDVLLSAGDAAKKPFTHTPLDFTNPKPDPYEAIDPPIWGLRYLFRSEAHFHLIPVTSFSNVSRSIGRGLAPMEFVLLGVLTSTHVVINLIAWNWTFPTPVERTLWRISSGVAAGTFFSYSLQLVVLTWQLPRFCKLFRVPSCSTATELFQTFHPLLRFMTAFIWVFGYSLARTYLIIEAIIGLRAVPASVFQLVQWSNFLPHF